MFEFIVIVWLAALTGGMLGLFIEFKVEHIRINREFIELYDRFTKEFKDVYDRMMAIMRRQ